MIQTITKDEFLAHFYKIFFSDETKRIDYELAADAHKEEQDKEREANKTH